MASPALPVLPWPARWHGPVLGSVALLTALLYAWPLVDGGASAGFQGVDRLLQLAAATAVGVAALVVSWRASGRDRYGLVVLACAAETWACVQAVQIGLELTGRDDVPGWLGAVGAALLGVGVGAALWLLRRPASGRRPARVALEWALLAASLLVLQLALWPPQTEAALGALRATAAALLGSAAVLTWLRPTSLARPWPLVPAGVALVALGLAAVSVLDGLGPQVLGRLPGALVTTGLGAGALGLLLGGAPRPAVEQDAEPPTRRLAPALLLCVVPLAALAAVGALVLRGDRPEPLPLAGAALIGLLGYGRLHLLAGEARAQARELAAAEDGLRHRAFHDELTGLANRALFMDRLARALDVHRRHRLPLSVLYGDLDGFKKVNDAHGHAAGDELLVAVAERFRACLRPEDTLARLGGDEFVLLLEHGSAPDVVAGRLDEALRDPFTTSAGSFRLSMSTGIAEVDAESPTPTPQQLVARADAQMYAAKQRTRAGTRAPAVPLQDRPRTEPDESLAAALGTALSEGRLQVVYQPVVDARTGDVLGLEALARWTHDGHPLPPSRFVDVAERFGLSGTLTDVVLEQACAQLRTWSDVVGHGRLTMAVNVSPSQLHDATLAERVRQALERHRLEPGQLVLETTVDALATTGGRPLHDGMAVPLSVGGFTGGPGDFALLQSVPVRTIKLDGRPRDAAGAVEGERLLRVLVALGRELDLRVVVERVERTEELNPLRALTGVLAQGNLLSRPAEPGLLDDLVRHGLSLPS